MTKQQQRARELRKEGMTYQVIAYVMGITRQRAHQLVTGRPDEQRKKVFIFTHTSIDTV